MRLPLLWHAELCCAGCHAVLASRHNCASLKLLPALCLQAIEEGAPLAPLGGVQVGAEGQQPSKHQRWVIPAAEQVGVRGGSQGSRACIVCGSGGHQHSRQQPCEAVQLGNAVLHVGVGADQGGAPAQHAADGHQLQPLPAAVGSREGGEVGRWKQTWELAAGLTCQAGNCWWLMQVWLCVARPDLL